jgi:hypothetical protein
VYPNGVANMYGYFIPSQQTANPYKSLEKIAEHIKMPHDNAIVAVYKEGDNYGYIPFQFVQVTQYLDTSKYVQK